MLYPLFDLAAAFVDLRSSRGATSVTLLYVNMAQSLLAAIGLAITAGLVQPIVGIRRRKLGCQWVMMISGGLSFFVAKGL